MMHLNTKIKLTEIVQWANALRNINTHEERTRALDALWSGQLISKAWLVEQLEEIIPLENSQNIYIFGGWIGILSNMMLQSNLNIGYVRSIDIDPWCEVIADTVNMNYRNQDKFKAITADMKSFEYFFDIWPDIVINTSTEHVSNKVYYEWYSSIPYECLIVAQGNNFYDCSEHVRCSNSLHEFKKQNLVSNELWSGELHLPEYTRYMAIWKK